MEHHKEGEEREEEGFMDKVKDFFHAGHEHEQHKKPTAEITGLRIPQINMEKAEFIVDVAITNPLPLPIPLVDVQYLIESEGRKLVSGVIPDAGTIHGHGTETINVPVVLVYDDVKSTFEDIKPGMVIPYLIRITLFIDIPIFGRLSFPLEKTGEIPVPYPPEVNVSQVKFNKFDFEETAATVHLNLHNKNDFHLGLNALDYEMSLADTNIASAKLNHSAKIEKQAQTNLKIPVSFSPKELGLAVLDMFAKKHAGYSFKGLIDVDTPFGNMKLPIKKEGGVTHFKHGGDDEDEEEEEQSAET